MCNIVEVASISTRAAVFNIFKHAEIVDESTSEWLNAAPGTAECFNPCILATHCFPPD